MKYPLSHLVFEVTSLCNLHCQYCYNIWKRPDQRNPELHSYSQAMKTLKRLFRIAEVDQLSFSGGEPLLAERFAEVVLFCRMKKKKVIIISNGTAPLNDYLTLYELGISLFEFPVHSSQADIHDSMVQQEGAWQKVIEAIRILREQGAKIAVAIVLTRLNFKKLAETLLFLNDLGINQIMLNRFNVGGEGIRHQQKLQLSTEELRLTFQNAHNIALKHNLQLSSNVCTPFCILNPVDFPTIRFGHCSDDVRKMPLTLDLVGNLRMCNHSPTVIGNIFEEDFPKIFERKVVKDWLGTIPTICRRCELYPKCRGGCRAAAEQLGWGLKAGDPLLKT